MCNKCYEKIVAKTGKAMLFCKLKEDANTEMKRLCVYQRYCTNTNKYIPHKAENCKYYKS